MKRIAILLTTGLLLVGGSAVRAADEENQAGPPALAPVPAAADPHCAAPCCGSSCAHHSRSCLDWLLYKPMRCHACCCVISPCTPPPYTWFLDYCQAAGCHGGCGYPTAVPGPPVAESPPPGHPAMLPEPTPEH